ncbi:MBL fold metallo-hydrolase [Intrasporangium calvum]|uniref:MBL fold metallo-hydrolase n=1 Tax=Intrasporangium calvum TaxID=53358 RepID=A0ABT5GMD6_9MICO|nr:MBL fold metallo-hydrolase [Intrasporangium calvum]MDC5699228.1 MBL fold metallo-hydrolase [Intrasporangium calvum]
MLGLVLAQSGTAQASSTSPVHRRSGARTKAVLVGTAGGPIWRQAGGRRGISTVVEVEGARYLVDAGHGSAAGLFDAGLIGSADGKNDLTAFRAGFITHLHSDHVTDLATLLVQGFIAGGLGSASAPFRVYGPGDRGQLPHVFPPNRPEPAPFNPEEPTPGTASMVRQLLAAFATDVNDRMFDATSPRIDTVIEGSDITLPAGVTPNFTGPPQPMRPFVVYGDDRVEVSATLVDHGQMVPSFAYRFTSDTGSIVVSGDTTLTPNLLEMADGCDVLLHEVIDYDTINASINGLPVPDAVKEAFRNHMFGAHTTEAQLAELLREIQVGTLVLHHMVPGDIANGGWARVAERLGTGARREVIAGTDGLVVGAR